MNRTVMFVLLLSALSCGRSSFFPLKRSNEWRFSGIIGALRISAGPDSTDGIYTLTYFDSLGTPLWNEGILPVNEQILWKSFEPIVPGENLMKFAPPLPLLTDVPGPGLVEALQIMSGPDTVSIQISEMVYEYDLERADPVTVPAGSYAHCLILRTQIRYLETVTAPLLAGENTWWYARGVGPVKYELPGGSGELISFRLH